MATKLEKSLTRLQKWFEASGATLALAESCTGGLLSSELAARPGVSRFFRGAIISYHHELKEDLLGVPASLIQVMGEVSTPVACRMARGAKVNLKSDWAIAITGIAGPSGGSVEKPVGTVCFAVVGPGVENSVQVHFGTGFGSHFSASNRRRIQLESVEFAIDFLWDSIHA